MGVRGGCDGARPPPAGDPNGVLRSGAAHRRRLRLGDGEALWPRAAALPGYSEDEGESVQPSGSVRTVASGAWGQCRVDCERLKSSQETIPGIYRL